MRIIGGKYGGKKLNVKGKLPVRPTTDFAKEGLFNTLLNRMPIEGAVILDLFAGTGSISFEFISRGAAEVYAADINGKCVNSMIAVSKEMQLDNFKVLKRDAVKFLKQCNIRFDIIFADPPYDLPVYEKLIDGVFENDLLSAGGLLIVEHDKRKNFNDHPRFEETRSYGNVHFTFFAP